MIPSELLEAFKTSLLSGEYNLLLGSGVSLDSRNGEGTQLQSAETLRKNLCAKKGVDGNTALHRVYSLLSAAERETEIIKAYSACIAGDSLKPLTNFLWRRLFTFNVDDVIESLYSKAKDAKQELISLNFSAPFEPTPRRDELITVHLHGGVRFPTDGFIFSYTEYARLISGMNPWMHLLSEILATESFIIAGTSLNEVDLEYYLSHRSNETPRRGKGPSLLIEPNADAVTKSDCERFGLTLVETTFGEFLKWVQRMFPCPPSLAELTVPDVNALFPDKNLVRKLVRFFSDFRIVTAADAPQGGSPSSFFYGKPPEQNDLDRHLDIRRADLIPLQTSLQKMLRESTPDSAKILTIFGDAGTGKTTTLFRIAHDLTRQGQTVFVLHTLSRFDVITAAECIKSATSPIVIVIDGFGDHVEQALELLENLGANANIAILAAERSYRREHIDLILGDMPHDKRNLKDFSRGEFRQLIEIFNQFGLVGLSDAVRSPDKFAGKLLDDPVAVAVCRILNDFRPLDSILDSLWRDTDSHFRLPFLCVALARFCHGSGIRYSILQRIAGNSRGLASLFYNGFPLPIAPNLEDEDYVVPLNSVLGDRLLHRTAAKDTDLLYKAFFAIGSGLAPHVNRRAIMQRSPEARLAGRLFDADKVVKPLLGHRAEQFYVDIQDNWKWNSRYWEQRALLAADSDLEVALSYARHAVAVEEHPHTLTTLGKLLFLRMESDSLNRESIFQEALVYLTQAIQREEWRSRITVHPYNTVLTGAIRFFELGEIPSAKQKQDMMTLAQNAIFAFPKDVQIRTLHQRLVPML
jgi:hypothetical protein